MKCPHCEKNITDSSETAKDIIRARSNAQNYGSSSFVVKCSKCHKKIVLYVERCTKITCCGKANNDADMSFG